MEANRARAVRRVLFIELLFNLLVSGMKAAYGITSGSLIFLTDAIHSLVDAGANIVGLAVTGAANAPPDREHPYGHHKLEIIAAAVLGVAIAATAGRFAWDAIDALIEGRKPPATSAVGFAVIAATLIINIGVATYEAKRARELRSPYLAADARHTATDVVITSFVLLSFAASYAGLSWADPVGALVVVAVIAVVAGRIIADNVAVLVDRAIVDERRVCSIAHEIDGVRGCHHVRSRGTSSAAYLDLHLQMDGDTSLAHAHHIAHDVEDALRMALPELVDVTIHMEPEDDEPEQL